MAPSLEQIRELPTYYAEFVGKERLDVQNHMNVAHYLILFDIEGWGLFAALGIDETYIRERQMGVMALRHVISYLAEVHEGDHVVLYSRLLGRSARRFHFMSYILNETQGKLAATMEGHGIHTDLKSRRSCPYPEDIAARFDQVLLRHQGLSWETELSGGINF